MSVLGCGLNTSGQLIKDGPAILCCPTRVFFPSNVTAASVAFSHILWRTASGWQLTGHDVQDPKRRLSLKSSWEVCACENRIAAINDDGSVLVWDRYWKALHFQKRGEALGGEAQDYHRTIVKDSSNADINTNTQKPIQHEKATQDYHHMKDKVKQSSNANIYPNTQKPIQYETLTQNYHYTKDKIKESSNADINVNTPVNPIQHETSTQDYHYTKEKVKESTNSDTNTNTQVKQTEHETHQTSKTRDVQNCVVGNRTQSDQNFEWRENVNKRRKLEIFAEREEKRPVTVNMCGEGKEKVTFTKVAVEDNALLALDSDGVMYRGSIPVPLRMKVKEVAVGKEHGMALTAAGDVITWGSGMRGQLGIGELCRSEKPVPVESLQGVPIATIDCGAWHCTALSLTGDLYVWGWNESGQLGFPYRCEGSQSLFTFFEHSCQCPKGGRCEGDDRSEPSGYHWCPGNKDSVCGCVRREGCEENHGSEGERISKEGGDERWNEGRSREVRSEGTIEEDYEGRRSKEQVDISENQEDKRVDHKTREAHMDSREGKTGQRIDRTKTKDQVRRSEYQENRREDPKTRQTTGETEGKTSEECGDRMKSKGMIENRVNPERRREVINVQASPTLMDFWTEDVNITNVQCGDRHTLYMLDDGSVWSAGMNRYGQLGLGHVRAVKEPCRVFRRGISDMCAGGWNSVFLISSRDSPS